MQNKVKVASQFKQNEQLILELKYTVGELFMPPVIQGTINLLTNAVAFLKDNIGVIYGLAAAFTNISGRSFIIQYLHESCRDLVKCKVCLWHLVISRSIGGCNSCTMVIKHCNRFLCGLSGVGLFCSCSSRAAALAVIYAAKSAQDSLNNSMSAQPGTATKQ